MKNRKIGGTVVRYLTRTVLWAVALAVISLAAPWTGLSLGTGTIGANALSACALGALGVPGVAVLLCVSVMF